MERKCIEKLMEWKLNPNRKPLIIKGARQVGKTWLMKEFAQKEFSKWVYINFEDNGLAKGVFEKDFDIQRIIMQLSVATKTVIDKEARH